MNMIRCVECHNPRQREGGVLLTGDRGPMFSHSYYMLTIARLLSDGRNKPKSSYDPRTLGSSASRILEMLDGSHYDVKATDHQKKLLRLWIESGAVYPGTYGASFLLPPGCSLSQVEVAPPCLNPIEPPGGWQPTGITTGVDLATTALKALEMEHELPPADTPIEIAAGASTWLRSAKSFSWNGSGNWQNIQQCSM